MTTEIHLAGAQLGALPITNTFLTTIVVVALILGLSWLATRRMTLVPGGWQNVVELLVEYLYNLFDQVTANDRKTRLFFPLVASFFIFILVSNYIGLLPGVGSIGFFDDHDHFTPILRAPTSDLNTALALGLFSVAATHYYSLKELGGRGYLAIWFSLNPILLFVGLLELVSEFTKIVSLSFRLFGNIFAGETVLEVISGVISPFLATLPFLGLELIVGFVQALVFAMLTIASLVLLTTDHSHQGN